MADKGQNITIEIAGAKYNLTASTPEMERCMRLAAQEINKRLSEYNAKYMGNSSITLQDKLALVSLTLGVAMFSTQAKIQRTNSQLDTLHKDLEDYLSKTDNR